MTVYIHIGVHKTGSTSLQQLLHLNEDRLAERGLIIPRAGRGKAKGANQHNLAWQLGGQKRFRPDGGGLAEVADEIREAANVILSAEGFEYADEDRITELRDAIEGHDVRVIAYLRRQDGLISSHYWQAVQTGRRVPDISEYVKETIASDGLDFEVLLGKWGRVFGEGNLRIGVISKEIEGPLLYRDFLRKMDAGDLQDLQLPNADRNASPSWPAIEIIRRLTIRHGKRDKVAHKRLLKQVQRRVASEEDLASLRLRIGGQDYAAVAARFAPGNAVVARHIPSPAQRLALEFGAGTEVAGVALDEERVEAIEREFW